MCINIQKETWEKQDWSNTKTLQFLGTEAGRAWLKVSIDWKCLGISVKTPMTLNKPNCNRKLASSLHKGQAQFKSWCMVWMKEAWRWCQESSRNIRNQLNGCSNLSKTKKRHGETRVSERVRERVCDSDSYRRCERATGRTMNQNLRNSHFFGELCWGPDVYRKTFFDWLQKYYAWRHDDSYFTYLRHMHSTHSQILVVALGRNGSLGLGDVVATADSGAEVTLTWAGSMCWKGSLAMCVKCATGQLDKLALGSLSVAAESSGASWRRQSHWPGFSCWSQCVCAKLDKYECCCHCSKWNARNWKCGVESRHWRSNCFEQWMDVQCGQQH